MIAVPAALLAVAAAVAPSDFAYTWPLVTGGDGGAWQVELTPDVHRVLVDPELRDVEVFDAAGRPVPVARYEPLPPAPIERRVSLPVFAFPRPAGDVAWDVRLRVARGPDRSLRQLASAVVERGPPPRASDYVLDASRAGAPIEALQLSWAPRSGETAARFAVEGSEDLEHWSVLVPAATVVSLERGGDALDRREIPVPASAATYLRLRALGESVLDDLRVDAKLVPAPPPPVRSWQETRLSAHEITPLPGDGGRRHGVYTYEVPGWLDVEAVRLEPATRSLAQVTVRSRVGEGETAAWLGRGGFTLVGVREGDEAVVRDEAAVNPGPRSRTWRIEALPPFDEPPRLFVSAKPDRFAFLAQGSGPYRLAAGSGSARRADAPVADAVRELRQRFGPTWEPTPATLGPREVAGGERALEPAPVPLPWKTWILWAVLAVGAGLVALLAVRLLRNPPASGPERDG
jgi:hypothetical protein